MSSCPFCLGKHAAASCEIYSVKSAKSKRNAVIRSHRCILCLGSSHPIINCPKVDHLCGVQLKQLNRTCRSSHHILLHKPAKLEDEYNNNDESVVIHIYVVHLPSSRKCIRCIHCAYQNLLLNPNQFFSEV